MANKKQAKKRAIQGEKNRKHNVGLRSMYRTYIKKVQQAIDGKQKKAAQEVYNVAVPIIDRMVTKGIMHKNKAARYKSRLSAKIKEMEEKE